MVSKTLTPAELMRLLDRVEYIDVAEIGEPHVNALRLVVEEMTLNVASPMKSSAPVEDALPVEHCDGDLRFEIVWDRYDVYQVLNESYDSGNGSTEAWEGNLFRRYSKSRHLPIAEEAFENIVHLDPGHRHWAVIGQNHIVDVISSAEPSIAFYRD